MGGSICWIQKLEKKFKRSLKLKVSENILDKEDVEELITEMESSDNIVIVNKDSIFS
jgi:hypothetical protein